MAGNNRPFISWHALQGSEQIKWVEISDKLWASALQDPCLQVWWPNHKGIPTLKLKGLWLYIRNILWLWAEAHAAVGFGSCWKVGSWDCMFTAMVVVGLALCGTCSQLCCATPFLRAGRHPTASRMVPPRGISLAGKGYTYRIPSLQDFRACRSCGNALSCWV